MKHFFVLIILLASMAQAATITITATDTAASAQGKINFAVPGADTINFDHSVITGTLLFRNGLTYTGIVEGKTSTSQPFISFQASATGITIKNLTAKANCGLFYAPSGLANSNITESDFSFGYNGTYFHKIGLQVFGVTQNLVFEHNTLHDSQLSDRDFDIHDCNGVSISYNTMIRQSYGGHVDGQLINLRIVGNVGSHYKQMMWEIQDNGGNANHIGHDVTVDSNVGTDWDAMPNTNVFGISVPLNWTDNVNVTNNYMSLGHPSPPPNNGNAGWCYEFSSYRGGKFTNNITVCSGVSGGDWKQAFNTSQPNTISSGNMCYGKPAWKVWDVEGGRGASWKDDGTSKSGMPISSAPPPPGGVTPPNPVTLTISNPTDVGFDYAIDGATGITSGTMTIKTTSGEQIGQTFAIAALKGTIVGCPTNWGQQAFIASGTLSASAAFHTTGSVGSPYPASLSMQPAVKGTTPPPNPTTDYHVDETHAFDIIGGKVQNETSSTKVTQK